MLVGNESSSVSFTYTPYLHPLHTPLSISTISDGPSPKTRIPGGYFMRNCVNPAIVEVFQRLGGLRCDFGARQPANVYKILLEIGLAGQTGLRAEGSFWVYTHSQMEACRMCPSQRQGTLTLE